MDPTVSHDTTLDPTGSHSEGAKGGSCGQGYGQVARFVPTMPAWPAVWRGPVRHPSRRTLHRSRRPLPRALLPSTSGVKLIPFRRVLPYAIRSGATATQGHRSTFRFAFVCPLERSGVDEAPDSAKPSGVDETIYARTGYVRSHQYVPTLKATHGQILSQSPTNALGFRVQLYGGSLKTSSICP